MKKYNVFILAAVFILSASNLFAQKIKSGDVTVLKGQTLINLRYDYSDMAVGKYKSESDYVANRTQDMNKKQSGSGDQWAQSWVNDRAARFQPMFEKNFNGKLEEVGVTAKEGASDAKYTLILRTVFTEPGFNVGVTRRNAYIDVMVDLVETAQPDKVIATIEMKGLQSVNMMGYDFDTGGRIQSCYDRAGDNLGKFLVKNVYK
ncbi:MAG TPA: hypothetical protein PKN12_10075 [Bacteroidales bacterium]|nr:hypothetical protein [Bacteroidales bacterium]HPT10216.1 hypothetical protein [Bacteroidales bacterium]